MSGPDSREQGPPPGDFFDTQVNGFGGVDFQDPNLSAESLHGAVHALRKRGVRRFFLTLITDRIAALESKLKRLERMREADPLLAETVVGYHLEGPWLSPLPGYCGAHPADCMQAPELRDFERLQRAAAGRVRLVTLAPEWPGSLPFIRELVSQGTALSIGHSDASVSEIAAAVEAGLRFCTHLGNGVPRVLDRQDNIIQRLLAEDRLTAFLIPDGLHLLPHVLKNMCRSKGPEGILFASDCMAAAGAPPGRYRLGALEVESHRDGRVLQPGEQLLAGSSCCLDEAPDRISRWTGLTVDQAAARCGAKVAQAFGFPVNSDFSDTP